MIRYFQVATVLRIALCTILPIRGQGFLTHAAAVAGDAASWYEQIANVGDRNRICGFAPTYLLLHYLGATSGKVIDYDQCPADPENNSLVSICGLLLN